MSDTTSLNKAYFNDEATRYDQKHAATLAQIVEAVRARATFIGVAGPDGTSPAKQPMRLLDYACGTGSLSRCLEPWITESIGVDLSEGMVAAFNARAQNEGKADKMRAVQANLCVPDHEAPEALAGPEFFNFDIAVVGLGFHHFDNPLLAARRLAGRLRPGGILLILDFLPHGKGVIHGAEHTVLHHGFSEERIKAIFEEAGVSKGYGLDVAGGIAFPMGERRVFLARGCKL